MQKDKLGFVVKSKSGRILLQSVPFKDDQETKWNLEQLRTKSNLVNKVERNTNTEGKFLFSVKNIDDSVIGRSGFYSSEAGMENGIKNFMQYLDTL